MDNKHAARIIFGSFFKVMAIKWTIIYLMARSFRRAAARASK